MRPRPVQPDHTPLPMELIRDYLLNRRRIDREQSHRLGLRLRLTSPRNRRGSGDACTTRDDERDSSQSGGGGHGDTCCNAHGRDAIHVAWLAPRRWCHQRQRSVPAGHGSHRKMVFHCRCLPWLVRERLFCSGLNKNNHFSGRFPSGHSREPRRVGFRPEQSRLTRRLSRFAIAARPRLERDAASLGR